MTQIFTPFTELVNPIEIPTEEANAEMETYSVIAEIKISECSM